MFSVNVHRLIGIHRPGRRLMRLFITVPVLVGFGLNSQTGAKIPDHHRIANICSTSAVYAARKTGVPLSVLMAISLTETGRSVEGALQPWPWTVNMEGKGLWFKDRTAALDYVNKNFTRGARSFDVGCFQINYKWHGKAFASISEMFEPRDNALYAARYLLELLAEKGNWKDAAGAYHSRTPKFANRYKKRFSALHTRLESGDLQDFARKNGGLRGRVNQYPLLISVDRGQPATGSLVRLRAESELGGLLRNSGKKLF